MLGEMVLIMALRIHFTSVISAKLSDQMKGSEETYQYFNYVINNLTLTNGNLKRDHSNLIVQVDKMAQVYAVLESNNRNLMAENQQLKVENQQLMVENQWLKRYTTQTPGVSTQNLQTTKGWYERYVTQTAPNYDFNRRKKRQCEPCHTSWLHFQFSCYAISNRDPHDQRTWEEARDDCRGNNADLVVIESPEIQGFIYNSSLASLGADGYWIGLRVEEGSWKWVNGSHLTESYWIHQPTDNHHCVISVKETNGWKSVSCNVKNGWICKKNALSRAVGG